MTSNYTNYDWFIRNDFSKYAGQWLAIIDQKVVAAGKNINEVLKTVKKNYPHRRPLVTKVRNKLSIL